MKKTYEAPTVERVEFKYRDQVVVASGICYPIYKNEDRNGDQVCETGPKIQIGMTN